ncbi:DUF4150 domain-containing protein [Enhygromyxa salina]|uniref:Uncharacterized protein n=1 Tax=Enhygromyxa salina TaxID=215803 RepID=A0A2S9YQU2_9BACT|nr:DUF4150 domain-containing protein [Enhygromyxa salina]PRQ07450.1 hypothetical protein ENSA7_28430 [Enhygromyxa salina]
MSVYANSLSIVHQGDGKTHTCPIPDVCKTPSPAGPVPIPYVNVAMSSNLSGGSTTVKIQSCSVALESSSIAMSSGDEAGTAGGVISSKNMGKLSWSTSSPNVKFEGKGVVRFTDVAGHNGNQDNTFTLVVGDVNVAYPFESPDDLCPNCGEKASAHESDNFPLPESEDSQKSAEDFSNVILAGETTGGKQGMVGALVCECPPDATKHTYVAVAGQPSGPSSFKGWAGLASAAGMTPAVNVAPKDPMTVRTARGTEVALRKPIDGKHPPGQCAAQKMIMTALDNGCKPTSMTETWARRDKGHVTGHSIPSCPSCKDNIAAMLCPNPREGEAT